MERIAYRFSLDVGKVGPQRTISGLQTNEKRARRIAITLVKDSESYPLVNDGRYTAVMYVSKPWNSSVSVNACTINDDGTIYYDILESDIEREGMVTMQLKVLKSDTQQVVVSPSFMMEVYSNIINDSGAASTTTFTALEVALAKAESVYRTRVTAIVVEDGVLRVEYADGSSYESDLNDAIAEVVLEQMQVHIDTLNGIKDETEGYKDQAEVASATVKDAKNDALLAADNASQSEINARVYAQEALEFKEEVDFARKDAISWANQANRFAEEAEEWAHIAQAAVGGDAVTYEPQTRPEEAKAIARRNIGAADVEHDHDGRYYTKADVDDLVDGKVDKVEGKGLSTNDFSNGERNRVNTAYNHTGVSVNSNNGIHGLRIYNEALEYLDGRDWKPITTKEAVLFVSQTLSAEQRLQARENIEAAAKSHNHDDRYYTKTDTDSLVDGKVDKVDGKGLSTNDYTSEDKEKLTDLDNNVNTIGLQVNSLNKVGGKEATDNYIMPLESGLHFDTAPSGLRRAGFSAYNKPSKFTGESLVETHYSTSNHAYGWQKAQSVNSNEIAIRFLNKNVWSAWKYLGANDSPGMKIALKTPENVIAVSGNTTVSLNWTDPTDALIEGYTFAKWAGTLVVRKEGSAPANENDGVVVVDSVIRDQYASEPFTDTGLVNDTEYFYGIFPYTEDGVYNYDCSVSVVPGFTPINLWTRTIGLNYNSLDDITEVDMRTLMSKHASSDYLYSWLSTDADAVGMFVSNALAMKWIGLRDYICDKLMSVDSIKTAMLASENWEYILKDKVPTMTSNTAPYGEVIGTASTQPASSYPDLQIWTAFDGEDSSDKRAFWQISLAPLPIYLGYHFTNPTCVKRFSLKNRDGINSPNDITLQASNDGINYVNLGDYINGDGDGTTTVFDVENNNYYLDYRIAVKTVNGNGVYLNIVTLQFYGRSLDVSVPTMTSNTAPYGEAFSSPAYSGHEAYGAFSRNGNYFQTQSGGAVGSYVGYKFPYPICIKKFYFKNENPSYAVSTFYYQVSNDGSYWTTIGGTRTNATDRNGKWFEVDSDDSYLYHRIKTVSATGITLTIMDLQFFGVDYSEHDDRTYLYDHGVEVVALTKTDTSALANIDVSDKSLLRATVSDYATASDKLQCGTAFALANNLPNNFYLDISNISGTQETGFAVIDGTHLDTTSLWLE